MYQSTTCSSLAEPAVLAEKMVEHEGLVRWVVRRQWLGGLPFDDALHEGRLGLWAALRRYDPQRGTTFSTYAVPAITHAVWHAVETHHRSPSLSRLPFSGSDSEHLDPAELVHRAQVRSALLDLVDHLPWRLRHIIVAHYGLAKTPPQTFAAIGQAMGITRQRVQQLHVKALLWLAHPVHSLPLRRLTGHHYRADYRKTLTRQNKLARSRRKLSPALRHAGGKVAL